MLLSGEEIAEEESLFHPAKRKAGAKDAECQRISQVFIYSNFLETVHPSQNGIFLCCFFFGNEGIQDTVMVQCSPQGIYFILYLKRTRHLFLF